jgi:hypothetical protein
MLVGNYSGGLGLFYGKPDKIFGIWEHKEQLYSSLLINPNPAGNEILVSFKNDFKIKPENMVIQTIDGKLIRKYSPADLPMRIDVSGYKNGIYLLSVQTNLGVASGKLVICR